MNAENGYFVVSLDFELMWGVRDKASRKSYEKNVRGVQQVIPHLLSRFREYGLHATFATVGMLFFRNKKEMLGALPAVLPDYSNPGFSPYGDYLDQEVGDDWLEDPLHFAPHLVNMIRDEGCHEIATHTFSHYYCLEPGQNAAAFKADLQAAIAQARPRGIEINSIIFPRNQLNRKYLRICRSLGILAVRSNEQSWLYSPRNGSQESKLRRCLRFIDGYINLSGHHCYPAPTRAKSIPVQIPSSRFLRPYNPKLDWLEGLRLNRIKRSMTHAAKNNLVYHLWWHPHNFGVHQEQNFAFLESILQHYEALNMRYGFSSITMSELAGKALPQYGRQKNHITRLRRQFHEDYLQPSL